MKDKILELLQQPDYFPLNVPELLRALHLPPRHQQELQEVLRQLEQSGRIARIKGNRYIQPREADLVPGRIRINRQGKGFLQPDDSEMREIVIPENATATALHEDRVLVRRDVKPKGLRTRADAEVTGTVLRILERKRTRIVGTLQESRRFLYIIPDDPRIPHDIYVSKPKDLGRPARPGDKVVVELQEWTSRHANPEGEIIEVLGPPDEEGVDMLSVLRQYNLPLHFPKPVLDQSRAAGTHVSPTDLEGRQDCRAHMVVTIDPDDAKDFDDAICLSRAESDRWKLWVHIADVSHYVKPGTALDEEARRRGNSTYLVDRVIPMLPEALSNELCSLKPNTDRLTKCVEFLLSADGVVLQSKFYPAVIHSQRRFTYREVFGILQRAPADAIERMLHDTHSLAQRVRRLRFRAGSLDLDFPESKIRLDDHGRVQRIEKVENDVSHQLIEECMLLANEAVASRLMHLGCPAVYRVHEEPDPRRLNEYREDVLSHHVPCGNLSHPNEVQKLLQRLNKLPIGQALKIGLLKSLMRARYDVKPLGHYGLAKAKYTHFTSPIRRYADLVVHRALFQTEPGPRDGLKETAEHISNTERNSADAERDSRDVKLYAFLKAQLQAPDAPRYQALVTEVRNFGFFVDVPGLGMSGLVQLSSLDDDFFHFDAIRNQMIGRRSRRVIKLGDTLEVQVAKVDSFKKQVDFKLAGTAALPGRREGKRPGQGQPQPQARVRRPEQGWRPAQGQRPGQRRGQAEARPGQRHGQRQAPSPGQRQEPKQGQKQWNSRGQNQSRGPKPAASQPSAGGHRGSSQKRAHQNRRHRH